jgi:hypothetical protein
LFLGAASGSFRNDTKSLAVVYAGRTSHLGVPLMIDNIDSLVLEHLRAIRAGQDELAERLGRVESRLTNLEVTTAGLRRDLR